MHPSTMTHIAVVRSSMLDFYAPLAASLGIDVIAMLCRSGLDRRCLADPDMLLPAARVVRLIESSAQAAGSSTFGIELSLGRGTPDLGPLGLLLREEPDLESVLRSLEQYFLVHSSSMTFSMEGAQESVFVKARLAVADHAPQSREFAVCGALQYMRWLAGADLTPVLVCFTHSRPANSRRHRALLRSAVEFEQDFDGVVFTEKDLSRPVETADPALRRHAEHYVRSLAQNIRASDREVVRRLVEALLPTGRCSAALVAAQLEIDRTTLARRLGREGTSYSRILQETRLRRAREACLAGWPLTRAAERAGFADLSTFSRLVYGVIDSIRRRSRSTPPSA